MEKCVYVLEQALFFVKNNGQDEVMINYLEEEIKELKSGNYFKPERMKHIITSEEGIQALKQIKGK